MHQISPIISQHFLTRVFFLTEFVSSKYFLLVNNVFFFCVLSNQWNTLLYMFLWCITVITGFSVRGWKVERGIRTTEFRYKGALNSCLRGKKPPPLLFHHHCKSIYVLNISLVALDMAVCFLVYEKSKVVDDASERNQLRLDLYFSDQVRPQ